MDKDYYLSKYDKNGYTFTRDEFFSNLATNLNSYYLRSDEFLNKLKTKEFLYCLKDSFCIYSTLPEKNKVVRHLNSKFKEIDVIGFIVGGINEDKLRDSIKSIPTIYNLINKTGQFIKVVGEENLKPQLLYIKTEWLNNDLLKTIEVDIDDIWINYEHELLKSSIKFDLKNDEYLIVVDKASNGKVIGLKVNDYILLKYDVDCKNYIKEEYSNQYLWKLLKENYFRQRKKTFSYSSELIQNFKANSKEEPFNKLLCNLKHNLYIDRSVKIEKDYQDFFEEFIVIKDLKDLSDLNFFLPDACANPL